VLPSVVSLLVATPRGRGSGSASIITDDGYLLTSAHVVDSADDATAVLADGSEL
jgi:S1-C subfamily serine protease